MSCYSEFVMKPCISVFCRDRVIAYGISMMDMKGVKVTIIKLENTEVNS